MKVHMRWKSCANFFLFMDKLRWEQTYEFYWATYPSKLGFLKQILDKSQGIYTANSLWHSAVSSGHVGHSRAGCVSRGEAHMP